MIFSCLQNESLQNVFYQKEPEMSQMTANCDNTKEVFRSSWVRVLA